jgi:Protein of unknown function (DUF2970)
MKPQGPLSDANARAKQPAASFGRSIKMVAWSFFGIRKNSEYQQDLASANPLHIILAAFAGVVILVVALVVLVNWVVLK